VYTMPGLMKSQRAIYAATSGWQLSGSSRFVSGDPITPGFSINGATNAILTGSFTEGARIALIGNPQSSTTDPYHILNPAAFAAPKAGSLGLESGVRFVTNPGIRNFDMSLQRIIPITERAHMQIRVDAFNVFNHPQFSGVNSTMNSLSPAGTPALSNPQPSNLPFDSNGNLVNANGFGTVSASRDARTLQTAVRIQF